MAVSADERMIAMVDYDGYATVAHLAGLRADATGINAQGNEIVRSALHNDFQPLPDRLPQRRYAVSGEGKCAGLAISADRKRMLTVSQDEEGSKISLREIDTGKKLQTIDGPPEYIDLAHSAKSNMVALGSSQTKQVLLFDFASETMLPPVELPETFESVTFDVNGETVWATSEKHLYAINPKTRETKQLFELPPDPEALAPSPDGKSVVVMETHFTGSLLRLFDLATGEKQMETPRISAGAEGAYVTPDGKQALYRAAHNASWGEPIFYRTADGQLDRSINKVYNELYFAKDGQTMIGILDRSYCEVDFVHLPDLFDDALQSKLATLPEGVSRYRKEGRYYVVTLPVKGRVSKQLLSTLRELELPVKLDLNGSTLMDDGIIELLENNPHIYGVKIDLPYQANFTAQSMKSLATLPNLEELVLNDLPESMLSELANFPQLRVLVLGIQGEEVGYEVLKQLQQLQILSIDPDAEQLESAVAAAASLPKLHTLQLKCAYEAISEETLQQVGKIPQLKRLLLEGAPGLATNPALAKLTNIRELTIRTTDFDEAALAQLKGLENLQGLDLYGCKFSDASALLKMKNLKWCRLPYSAKDKIEELSAQRPDLRFFE